MKKYFGKILVTAGIILGLSSYSFAAGGSMKLGYFDANGAAMQSQWGKKVIDELKREQERLSGELDRKGQTFKTKKEEFDKKKDVMDEKSRNRNQKELQELAAELEKTASESTAKFNQYANQTRGPLFQKISEIVNKIGKDEKYDFIFEKGSLHYANDKDDLTRRISTELDKNAPR